MGWQTILALVLIIPVLLIPVALVWYIHIGGFSTAMKEARARRTASRKAQQQVVQQSDEE
jgi:hypothetical protein